MMSRRQKYVFDYLKQMTLYDPRRERSNSKMTLKLKGLLSLKQHILWSVAKSEINVYSSLIQKLFCARIDRLVVRKTHR